MKSTVFHTKLSFFTLILAGVLACSVLAQDQIVRREKAQVAEYLKQITMPIRSESQVKMWIDQLGDDQFTKREAATKALAELNRIPVDLLKEATRSDNLERASRARRILKIVIPRQRQDVEEAFRMIEKLEISGLAEEVLNALRSALVAENIYSMQEYSIKISELSNEELLNLARAALVKTVTSADLPQLQSAIENETAFKGIAIYALSAKGLTMTDGLRKQLNKLWNSGASVDQLASAEALLARGDRDALERFVILLESTDVDIRSQAARRLWHATGQNLAFDANESLKVRNQQVAGWRAWLSEFAATARIRTEPVFSKEWRGRTLVAGYVSNGVVEYDRDGNKTWQVKLENASGCCGLLTGERVVFSRRISKLIVYASGDGPPRELWRLNESCQATPMLDGDILVWGASGTVKRFDRKGNKLWETREILWKGTKRIPLEAAMLPNGNIQVIFWNEPKRRTKGLTAIEINQQGAVIRELVCRGRPLDRLTNGNQLFRNKGGRVVELTPAGNVVWSYGIEGRSMRCAQRLPDGNTLVADYQSAVDFPLRIVSPKGTTVWSKYVGHVSQVHVY